MKKRSTILIICLAMLITFVFAGCNGGTTTTTTTTTGTTAPGETTTAPAEWETFSFSVMGNDRGADAPDTPANEYWLEVMQEKLQMYLDIDWIFVPGAEYDEKININLSSGDLPDYFMLPFIYNPTQMANEGFFLDFAQYDMSNYVALVEQTRQGVAGVSMENGMMPTTWIVVLPIMDADKMSTLQTNAVYNYTVFQRENLEIPATMDELLEVARVLKERYPSSYPINVNYIGVFAFFHAWHVYANQNGAGTLYWDGDQYTFAGMQPQYKDALKFIAQLYDEGLFDPEYIIDTVDTVKTKMLTEENFMLMNSWRTHNAEYTRDSGGDYVFVSAFVPDNPTYGKAWQTFGRDNQVSVSNWTTFAVSADTENPELLTRILNMQYTPEIYEITSWGIPNVTYTIGDDGQKRFVDEFYEADDPARVSDKYGLWNDRSGRSNPGLRVLQDNLPRAISFPDADYTFFGGKYEEGIPVEQTEFFMNTPWPNDYIPPHYNAPVLSLTVEENTQVSQIMTLLNTYTSEMQAAFIAGDMDIDAEWDSFMDTFMSYDLQTVLDIHNAAAQRYFDSQ